MASDLPEDDLKAQNMVEATPTVATPPPNGLDEKAGGENSDSDGQERHHHHPHVHLPHHLRGRRMLSFVHPHTGKHTHICHTPDELGLCPCLAAGLAD